MEAKREGDLARAEALLLRAITAVEAENRRTRWGMEPYYEYLAGLYRKQRRYTAEVAILERYFAQPYGSGGKPLLRDRLDKARALASRASRPS